MNIIRKSGAFGLVSLNEYINTMTKTSGKCSKLSTFSSGEDESMANVLRKSAQSDSQNLTRTFLIINLNEKEEIDYENHQIFGYYSLSSHYVTYIKDTTQDFESGFEGKRVETKYPSVQIDSFARNHKLQLPVDKLEKFNSGMGKLIFNLFIVPQIVEISNQLGFNLITLFCADHGDGKLIKTYKEYGFVPVDIDYDDDFTKLNYSYTTGNSGYKFMAMKLEKLLIDNDDPRDPL